MDKTCGKCGGRMEAGVTKPDRVYLRGASVGSQAGLVFIVPGAKTSMNPITAFKQGLSSEESSRGYRVEGFRCSSCGFLEMYGGEEVPVAE
jgi:hypothetical protein